jgi:hypothetical protein
MRVVFTAYTPSLAVGTHTIEFGYVASSGLNSIFMDQNSYYNVSAEQVYV